ncbi:MAG: beta-ketoacyl-[acyl-carrier-protein] synthase family protein [Gemmatimonadetes bacterium]|nr:beta-ketoacyl-[acyl-carrier-protein] synthase family protein [Gemmatimonadota bacterium]
MLPPRVVITGMGAVAPGGHDVPAYWASLASGRSSVGAISLFDASRLPCSVAAEVRGFPVHEFLPPKTQRLGLRVVAFSLAAATEALAQAGLDPARLEQEQLERFGVIVGTGAGGIEFGERQYGVFYAANGHANGHKVSPYAVLGSFVGMLSSEINMAFGLKGMSHVISTGCTSASDAMGYAHASIRSGAVDMVLTGGAEACIAEGIMTAFCRMGTMTTTHNDDPAGASRPFNRDRNGFVMGEGAWMLVFERLESALARGATILAEVAGYASTCDAYHRVRPEPSGEEAARAITLALAQAGTAREEVGYLSLHGTATELNDRIETRAVRLAFGDLAPGIPTSGIKSMIGHAQGACGAAAAIATVCALREGFLPPTINYSEPDPACDLDYVPNVGRPAQIDAAVVNTIAFGSKNSALVVRRYCA